MSASMLVFVSLVGLTVTIGYVDLVRRRPRRVLPSLCLAALSGVVFVFGASDGVEAKGGADETAAVAICYAAMLLGMAAEYFYSQVERGEKTLRFEAATFLMPIFASPIVFIPLLTLTRDVAAAGAFSDGRLMVYLVAFQNGFFWKGFFEQRRAQVRQQPEPMLSIPPAVVGS